MDPPSVTTNPIGKESVVVTADESKGDEVAVTILSPTNPDDPPTVIIDPSLDEHDISVTPSFPSFPTNEEVIVEPTPIAELKSSMNNLKDDTGLEVPKATTIQRPSQHADQLINEIKYLLRPTNSLASTAPLVQASQEADSAIRERALSVKEDARSTRQKLLIEGLTPREEKSLDAAHRRSIAARDRSFTNPFPDKSSRSQTVSEPVQFRSPSRSPSRSQSRSQSQSAPNILIAQSTHRTFIDHLPGIVWGFVASYSFTIILFLTKFIGLDLVFGFFLQMIVQTVAFAVYAYYKDYNLLSSSEHRKAMMSRSLLVGIGALTSYLAYYFLSLPELMAIRHSQVALTILLSILFLHERITIPRIGACIVTVIAVVLIAVPVVFLGNQYPLLHTEYNKILFSRPFIWNYLIGMSLALCTALSFSTTTLLTKNFLDRPVHNSVLCFWSALFALILSFIFLILTHYVFQPVQLFPKDWRLYVGVGLAVASIFVFIANQKAIKREGPSIVTLIYSTDIILALILQNLFTKIQTTLIVILGCILVLLAIVAVCTEVLLNERRKRLVAAKVARATQRAGHDEIDLKERFIKKTSEQRISV